MLLGIFPILKKPNQLPNTHNNVYSALAANSCFITKLVFSGMYAYSVHDYYMVAQGGCPASETPSQQN